MTHLCAVCTTRPVDGTAYACHHCTTQARRDLLAIADHAGDARAVATGQTRRCGTPARGGHPGSRVPIDLGAVARLDAAQTAITTWARHVASERGVSLPQMLAAGRTWPGVGDPMGTAARWLVGHLEWVAHRQEVDEAYRDIGAARRIVTGITAGPGDRRWIGQCGQPDDQGQECGADLYARPDATTATCRTCGTRHDVAARRAWLDQVARDHAYTAREIQDAYGIRASTIRVWAHRQLITADADGRYPLGPVLDVAASEVARRAAARARRARRLTPA